MSIAALLDRARAQLAAGDHGEAYAAGDVVTNGELLGRVAFVEDGWIHWVDERGDIRASRPHALRRDR